MLVKFDAQTIIATTAGRLLSGEITKASGSICSNIQELSKGQWFIALPEARTDGHDQLQEAIDAGAMGCIVVDNRRYPFVANPSQENAGKSTDTDLRIGIPLIGVPSTVHAYYQLANLVRRKVDSHGTAYLRDAWCAIACAREFGMADHKIAEGLRRYDPSRGRGNKSIGRNGALIIDESYSANPDSVRATVTAFLDSRAFPQPRKFVVLGAMEELGEASEGFHVKLGDWLSTQSFEALITIGEPTAAIVRG